MWAAHCSHFSLQSMGSRHAGSIVAVGGLSCSTACGIFPDQGSNPVSCISRQILYHWAPGKFSLFLLNAAWYFIIFTMSYSLFSIPHWRTCAECLKSESGSSSHSVRSNSLRPLGLYSPWNCPGQNTGVGSLSLLQGIFPTQGLNPGLLHCRWILYQLSY